MSFYSYDDGSGCKEILTADEAARKVRDSIEFYESRAKMMEERNKILIDNAKEWVENKLKIENENLKRRIKLCLVELQSEKELESYLDFKNKHEKCRACAKIYQYQFPYVIQVGNSFGYTSTAICPICNEKKDITDTEVW